MTAPEWVSKELFEEGLREYFQNKNIEILGFTSAPALAVGENYTSDIFRTTITYTAGNQNEKKALSVIVKCFPQVGLMVNLVQEMALFETEVTMYTKIFPAIYKLLGNSESLSAKCIYSAVKPHGILIFEDLSPLGFKTANRQQGLDLEHCLLVVEKLACLHATSMLLCKQDPSIINNFTKAIYRDNEFTKQWISTGFDALSEVCAKWPGFEKYSAKLKALKDQAAQRTLDASQPKPEELNVLNHGDAWINNFMFSYTPDGKIKDFRFVDLQIVFYSSPAIDLNYFWATSPNIDVKIHHLDTVLDHYYTSLAKILLKVKYPEAKVPTKEQLRKEFDSRAFYGLAAAVTAFPVVVSPSRNDATIEEFMDNDSKDSFRDDAFKNEKYREHMEYYLPYVDNLGALN